MRQCLIRLSGRCDVLQAAAAPCFSNLCLAMAGAAGSSLDLKLRKFVEQSILFRHVSRLPGQGAALLHRTK